MKVNIKPLILIVFGFIANLSFAQMQPCCSPPCPSPLPPDCAACSSVCTNCMVITVVNVDVPCALDLYWGYSGCTYILGYAPPISAGSQAINIPGPCAKCPGDGMPCECPNKLTVSISATQQWWPWGDFTTMIANGNTTYQLLNPNNTLCPGCARGVQVVVTITGANSATLTFSCI